MRRAVTSVVLLVLVVLGSTVTAALAEPTARDRVVAPSGLRVVSSDVAPDLAVLFRSMGAGAVATDGGAIGAVSRDRSSAVISVVRFAGEDEAVRVFDAVLSWAGRGEFVEDGIRTRIDRLDSPGLGAVAYRNRSEIAEGQSSEMVEVVRRLGRDLVFVASVPAQDVTALQRELVDAQTAAFPDEIVPLPDEDTGVPPVLVGVVAALLLLAGFAVVVRRRRPSAVRQPPPTGPGGPVPGLGGANNGRASVSW